MAKEGAKKVPIAGIEDKRQITGLFAIILDGKFLLPQLTYQGTTSACLSFQLIDISHAHKTTGQMKSLLKNTFKELLIPTLGKHDRDLNL